METIEHTGEHQTSNKTSRYLNLHERELVDVAVSCEIERTIHSILHTIGKNFTPAECADIIRLALQDVSAEPGLTKDITRWVEDFQMGKSDIGSRPRDFGTWSNPVLPKE